MTKKELLKLIEDEVSAVISTPLKEPEISRKPKYKTVLQTEDEIDEFMFFGGHRPKEEKEKSYKKLLKIGKN